MNPKVIQTIIEMLDDRQYKIEDKNNIIGIDENKKTLKVYFIEEPKVGIKHINEILENMETEYIDFSIIVITGSISSFAKQLLVGNTHIQLFHEDELCFNITHHEYVPKHQLLSQDEKIDMMKLFNINEKQIPRIYTSDPVCKYFGGKRGNVFKITRHENNNISTYYRLCI